VFAGSLKVGASGILPAVRQTIDEMGSFDEAGRSASVKNPIEAPFIFAAYHIGRPHPSHAGGGRLQPDTTVARQYLSL
jgi:hypothetical protein